MKDKKERLCSKVLMMSRCVLTVALISGGMFSTHSARAQGFPTKPIEIVVPWGPGVVMDLVCRLIADLGPKYLGQSIIVTNKPGAGASIGLADVVASKPDGYKLYVNNHAYFANTIYTQKLPFDPLDLVPVANFIQQRQAMAVKADSPFKTLNDLLQYARKNPGKLKWAHLGRGMSNHQIPMLIFKKEGVITIDVPYRGGSVEACMALMGGHVDMASVVYASVLSQFKAGDIRFLVFFSGERFKEAPNVPAITELGYPEANQPLFMGLYVHKNTPEHIKKILTDFCKKVYDDPGFKKGLEKIDAEPMWGGPDFVSEWIKKSTAFHVPILKELGLYMGK